MKAIIIAVCVSSALVMLITANGAIASTHGGGNGHSYVQHGTFGYPHRGGPREPRRLSETNQTVWHTWCVEHPQACRIVRRR
jgi:hypothetical protein